ncbi:MAG: hypothetical protein VKI81_10125 [Synechococcaceae cyanobacterium]|nr:hypothetical protein [Synechococcaceae cyanobacterium]
MGELMQVGAGASFGSGALGAVLSLAALGIFALMRADQGDDDDDSTPGGGLMQPVA